MNRPPLRVMVIGHPVVAVPILLACAGMIYGVWSQGLNELLPTLFCGGILLATGKSAERASAYRQWKLEWDGMAGAPRCSGNRLLIGGLLLSSCVSVYLLGGLDQPDAGPLVFDWLVGLFAPGIVLVAFRFLRATGQRPRRAAPAKPVAVIARPILAAPTLDGAYAALPEYCRAILTAPVR